MYVNRLDNFLEMDKFLETQDVPRLKHEEIKNLYRPITSEKIESAVIIIVMMTMMILKPIKKSPG